MRPALILGFVFLFAGFFVYAAWQAVPKIKAAFKPGAGVAAAWEIKETDIDCPDEQAAAFLAEQIEKNQPLNDKKAADIKTGALARFGNIKELEIKKGLVTGKLYVSCVKSTVRVEGGAPGATLSALIKDLEDAQKILPFERAVTDENYTQIKIELHAGPVIILGDNLNIKNKTKTARKILEYAKAQNLPPGVLDFSYYKYSKAYLTTDKKHGKK